MSEKKLGSKIDKRHEKVGRRIVRVYEKLKEGPASVKELADKLEKDGAFVGIITIDKEIRFALSVLKGIGVVEEGKDGKYRVIGRKIILKGEALRNALILHSKDILRGISPSALPDPSEIISKEEYKYLLEHLETGYPEVYSNIKEMKKIEEEIQAYQKERDKKMSDYLSMRGVPMRVKKNKIIYHVISYTSVNGKSHQGCLAKGIKELNSLTSVYDINRKLEELKRNYEERKKKYKENMKNIIRASEQFGLQGWCSICYDHLVYLAKQEK